MIYSLGIKKTLLNQTGLSRRDRQRHPPEPEGGPFTDGPHTFMCHLRLTSRDFLLRNNDDDPKIEVPTKSKRHHPPNESSELEKRIC